MLKTTKLSLIESHFLDLPEYVLSIFRVLFQAQISNFMKWLKLIFTLISEPFDDFIQGKINKLDHAGFSHC